MIPFRYHLVTLVALFFALAVGIVAGSTVVDRGLISRLESQRTNLQRQQVELQDQADGLRAEVALWEGFGDKLLLPSLEGRLNGLDVTLVLPPYTPDPLRLELRTTLRAAGARVDGEVRIGPRVLLDDETAAEQLALALDAGTRRGEDLLRAAGTFIGERIGPDLLSDLAGTNFERNDFVDVAERRPGSASQHATVIAWDATTENRVLARSLMVSMLSAAAERNEPIAVAEVLEQNPSLVTRIRDNDALRTRIASIDHAGTTLGAVALAVALAEAVDDPATILHYGVQPGARGVLPGSGFRGPGKGGTSRAAPPPPSPTNAPRRSPTPERTGGDGA